MKPDDRLYSQPLIEAGLRATAKKPHMPHEVIAYEYYMQTSRH